MAGLQDVIDSLDNVNKNMTQVKEVNNDMETNIELLLEDNDEKLGETPESNGDKKPKVSAKLKDKFIENKKELEKVQLEIKNNIESQKNSSKYSEKLSKEEENLKKKELELLEKRKETIDEIIEEMKTSLSGGSFENLFSDIGIVFSAMFILPLKKFLGKMFSAIVTPLMTALTTMTLPVIAISGAFVLLGIFLWGIFEDLKTAFEKDGFIGAIKEFFAWLSGIAESLLSVFVGEETANKILQPLNQFLNSMIDFVGSLVNLFTGESSFEEIKNNFMSATSNLGKFFTNIIEMTIDKIFCKDTFQAIKDKFISVFNPIIDFFKNIGEKLNPFSTSKEAQDKDSKLRRLKARGYYEDDWGENSIDEKKIKKGLKQGTLTKKDAELILSEGDLDDANKESLTKILSEVKNTTNVKTGVHESRSDIMKIKSIENKEKNESLTRISNENQKVTQTPDIKAASITQHNNSSTTIKRLEELPSSNSYYRNMTSQYN